MMLNVFTVICSTCTHLVLCEGFKEHYEERLKDYRERQTNKLTEDQIDNAKNPKKRASKYNANASKSNNNRGHRKKSKTGK